MIDAVVLDVGETIIKDDRGWASWADWLGVPRHTLSALVGAVVAQGRDNADAIRLIRPGIDLCSEARAKEAAGCGEHLDETDLYPDVRPALQELRSVGLNVFLAGNQTARAGELLNAMGLPVDAIATSAEWGVAKPTAAFFDRVVALAGAAPDRIAYVGDHPANDCVPAAAAGLRTAHLRRGPLGHLWADSPEAAVADWRIESLMELPGLLRRTPR
ncbi:HAD family hydrolase [Streptomyces sp. AV19]|uniref:HAD family hydrolase n=1 Tax=Streptomyces sp. AV19 TaxID=2793068 RepID=UPI0018FEFCA8|nr:HAD family hydrolase [Streptomyces sp. AV19]MBH1937598.1 HAD family hydrolase [Streptomyces sp. AV19]MDG4536469.1 HAD family hydrolase [Streptomyces sp. AV19]